jgi:hypothetical protein
MMEEKKLKQKELLYFNKSLIEAAKKLENDIQNDSNLSEEEKANYLRLILERGDIEEIKQEVRLEQIRQLESFKDYQIFLKNENIKRLGSEEKVIEVSEIEKKMDEIGKSVAKSVTSRELP